MLIQFLKWKLKIQFSIFNFWKYYSLNSVFNKKFEIKITLNFRKKNSVSKPLVVELTLSTSQ